jgi:dihydrolipoamide dehydrogenase
MSNYDLVVIGSGPGGYVAAIRAAQLGLNTVVVERAELGGVCLNWGCIPTKALLHSASLYSQIKSAKKFGINANDATVDFPGMVKHSRTTASRLSKGIEFLFKKNKITTLVGDGQVVAKGKVKVTGPDGKEQTVETKNILVAAGARPRAIPGVDFDGDKVISSKEAMVLPNQPKSLVIIGAGAIGVEFAYFYNTIGTKVTLVEMMPQILPIEDKDVADEVTKAFKKAGMKILVNTKVEKVTKNQKGVKITVSSESKHEEISADAALVAIGVQGNYENLGLEALGIEMDRGYIKVDSKNYKTNVDGIFAIGDIIGPPWLAHVASAEGITAVETMAGKTTLGVDYNNIPGCTYCQPQVASLGFTEEKAKELGYDIKVGKVPFRAIGKALAMGHGEGFAKLIFDAKYGELLGAHLVGPEVTELLAELNIAKTLETTADDIMHTVHAHPTLSEVIKEAAEEAFGKAIHI